jgi:two-component system CheB/CheR fusion protein
MKDCSILYVEDEYVPNEQEDVHIRHLKDEKFSVTTVSTVAEALEALRSNSFDIVVLDVRIPQSSGEIPSENGGFEVIEYMKQDETHKATPIVIVSAYLFKSNVSKTLSNYGVTRKLSKPIWPQELANIIKDILRS